MDPRFWAYLSVATLLIVTPGPDTALVTRNALRAGRRSAHLTTLGVAAGSLVWGVATALGIAVLLQRSQPAFTALKLAGAAYLGWLGVRSLIGSRAPAERPADRSRPAEPDERGRASFRQGLLNNLLNPKAGLIFVTVIPQFIRPGDSPARLALMMVAYESVLLAWLGIYAEVLSRAALSPIGAGLRRVLERVLGVVLVALAARMAFERS